ncbi:amino acid adenylation domain-containing protein, partial [Kitasatospora sp. NPDC036755]|uniref:amino acid adenylation domain-containing protein n=1 Tax=Kitasatospora sp. NPDC036755 TaxID=3154600 RepID=UPI0034056B4B
MDSPAPGDGQPVDLLTRFQTVVQYDPDRIAVRATDGDLSFAQLDRLTAGLANQLAARGIQPGDRVGVSVERSSRLPAVLLGVWRAGAAYVPLDPDYPADRLAYMATDSGIRFVVTGDIAAPVPRGVEPLVLSDPPTEPGGAALAARGPESFPGPAYLIYTSGSTGTPKGVEVTRPAVAALVASLERTGFYPGEPTVVAWNASASFDASVQQWARICRGDTVVVLDAEQRRDPDRLAALLAEYRVTDLDLTPTHWRLLRGRLLEPRPDGSRLRLFVGGEAVPADTWAELAFAGSAGGPRAINLYGPTECTVDATAGWIEGAGPHIGTALPDVLSYVLDEQLRPVSPGQVGELYLGGTRLAVGYANQSALTASRFVADPFGAVGARMYRTGDRTRHTTDGVLEYVDRVDRQVKFRGFRVELGEIEA